MIKTIKSLFYIIFLFSMNLSCAQDKFTYKEVPASFLKTEDISSSVNLLKNKAFKVVDILPTNYKKDASQDYTMYLQKAIDENAVVLLPDFPILVNDKGIKLNNNSVLLFDNNSQLKLKPTDKGGYAIININNKKNVSIYNAKIIGDRNEHLGTKGEWGMGISINDASDVKVYNAVIKNCWGDGIYIGGKNFSNNVTISGGLIDNNRRNGISIIGGDNILLQDLVISNSNGANPQTGIDLEPNNQQNKKLNVSLKSILTFNNKLNGLSFYLDNLKDTVTSNNVQILVDDYRDLYSTNGMSYSNRKSETKKSLNGSILLNNIDLKYNVKPFRYLYNNSSLDNINLKVNDFKSDHKDNNGIVNDLQKFSQQRIKYNNQ
ncbi:right-handed parallel beta-helix repeat-containing protein [Chryseobacterium gleum]|uniref:right-handed parallel beta-helix repeat-containing protein n=1 Tax=Chryseobacterium gleum TaxID=250 RepID=UPI0031D43FC2